jgi:hypothetical protein
MGRGAFSEEEAEEHYDRSHWTVNLDDMAGVDVAIEAIVEKVRLKKEVFAVLDEILPPDTLLLTNTSSISHTGLASATGRPDKVCGTYIFTPPPVRVDGRGTMRPPHELLGSQGGKSSYYLFRQANERPEEGGTRFRGKPVPDADAYRGRAAVRGGGASKEEIDLLIKATLKKLRDLKDQGMT